MMSRTPTVWLLAGILAAGCVGDPVGPQPVPVRDVLYRGADGALYLVMTDGSLLRRVGPTTLPPLVPLALGDDGITLAVIETGAVSITTIENLRSRDTVLAPVPSLVGPGAFSPDMRWLAVPARLAEGPALLLFDRNTRIWTTVIVGEPGFATAPAFSPDGAEIAGLGVTTLSAFVVRVRLSDFRPVTEPLGTSRFLNAPVFGWPRWVEGSGFHFLAVRGELDSGGPDTLVVLTIDPMEPDGTPSRRFAVLSSPAEGAPDLFFGEISSYALSADADQVIVAAYENGSLSRHRLWTAATGDVRVSAVISDTTFFAIYPRLLN
jgi:hypothetical protein